MKALIKDPIYCQVNDLLRDMIRGGEFQAGDRFLTERQIGERFGISRATANKALSNLVAEGVLEFRKGVGTFLRGGLLDYDLRALVSFTEKARAAGKTPTTQVLCLERALARDMDEEIGERLRLEADAYAYYLVRLRLADDLPVILERRYLVADYCPDLTEALVSGSLYATLSKHYRLDVAGADEAIRAVNLHGDDARLLKVESGAAGLAVDSTAYLGGGVPLWWERTLYRGDAYEFHNRLGPMTTARSAVGKLIEPRR
jgi:GntR family transcriptional regulator